MPDVSKTVTLELKLSDSSGSIEIYHANADFSGWSKVQANIGDSRATIQARSGGVYVARTETNVGMIVGLVIGSVVLVVVVAGSIFYFSRNPSKWQAVRTTCRNAKRSTSSKI